MPYEMFASSNCSSPLGHLCSPLSAPGVVSPYHAGAANLRLVRRHKLWSRCIEYAHDNGGWGSTAHPTFSMQCTEKDEWFVGFGSTGASLRMDADAMGFGAQDPVAARHRHEGELVTEGRVLEKRDNKPSLDIDGSEPVVLAIVENRKLAAWESRTACQPRKFSRSLANGRLGQYRASPEAPSVCAGHYQRRTHSSGQIRELTGRQYQAGWAKHPLRASAPLPVRTAHEKSVGRRQAGCTLLPVGPSSSP